MRRLTIVLGLLSFACFSGCGDNPEEGQDMSVDMVMSMDLTTPPDLTMFDFKGISCGTSTCDPTTQDCCVVPAGMGFSQMCMPRGTCSTDGGASIMCDGPEDCSGGNSCCITVSGSGTPDGGVTGGSGSSMCSMACNKASASFGGGSLMATTKMCHLKSDCAGYSGDVPGFGNNVAFDGCCESAQFGAYKFCAPTLGASFGGYTCN